MTSPERARVTQRVAIDDLTDLATNPPRAALAFSTENGPECMPAAVRSADHIEVGVDRAALAGLDLPDRATLVVDDGRYWFELRAIVRRGALRSVPDDNEEPIVWFTFETHTSAAWDYGALHEEMHP
jgi:hypothetical protein